jgi:citrate synthase
MKPPNGSFAHVVTQEAEHVRRLFAELKALLAENEDDEQLQSDLVESETGLVEAVDQVLLKLGADLMAMQAIDMHIDGLKDRKSRIEQRTDKIKRLLESTYKATGMTKPLHCPLATVSLRAQQDEIEIMDEAGIPAVLWRQPPPPEKKIDKVELRKALELERTLLETDQVLTLEQAIPGARLIARDKALSLRWK